MSEATDPIKPAYYRRGGIEAWDVIEAWELDYHTGTALKYLARAGRKDSGTEIQDLQKARAYIDRRIEYLKGNV